VIEFGDERLPDRFWSKARKDDSGCWLWTASRFNNGYGQYRGSRAAGAHREAYLTLVGEVPEPLVLDHLCRVRHCVNPNHLEPVTQQTNILRGDLPSVNVARSNAETCRNGLHPWTAENIHTNAASGRRQCLPCLRVSIKRYKEKQRGHNKDRVAG
jgi:hypothetical protein